jgi:micrococcal nuclease
MTPSPTPSARRRLVTVLVAITTSVATGCSTQRLHLRLERAPTSVATRYAAGSPDDVASALNGPGPVDANASVVRVVDGDTVHLLLGDTEETVRLIGIDTPETHRPGTPVQCFGPEATRFTAALLPKGTAVRLERDVEARDRYGRLLGYVIRADDGLFVNLQLARQGFAHAYTFPPNIAHADEFVAAAGQARDEQRGLWSRCGDG